MNLNDDQRSQVKQWIAEGLKLADIQSRVARELGVSLTYMEVRLLVDDLKLMPKDHEVFKPELPAPPTRPPAAAPAAKPPAGGGEVPPLRPAATLPAGTGGVSVSVDQVTRPGALVSGKVTFSDQQQADWYLDQMGRLGVQPRQPGYKPSQADVQEFQLALQDELARLGM